MQPEHITNFIVIAKNISARGSGLLHPLRALAMTANFTAPPPVIASGRRMRGNPDTTAVKRLRLWMASSLAFFTMTMMVVLLGTATAYAQQTQPNDSCTTAESGRYRLSGGPDLGGDGYLLTCNGTQWIMVFGFESDGIFRPQYANSGACATGDTISYDATGGLRCMVACSDNTPDNFAFTDQVNTAPSTMITSNIVQITGINCQITVSISGQGSPQYRICDSATCAAGTIVQDWTDATTPLNENQYVQMRLTSSAIGGDSFSAQILIGNSADTWRVTPSGDCAAPSPAPGTICADGTIYVGTSPDGNVKMYTTRCAEGRSWNGTACIGSWLSLPWNNGNGGDSFVSVPTSSVAGAVNTATLVATDADSETSGHQDHRAAKHCADSTAHGYTDWYLPATTELAKIYDNRLVIHDMSSDAYWSSHQNNLTQAYYQRMTSLGGTGAPGKNDSHLIRCVRKD